MNGILKNETGDARAAATRVGVSTGLDDGGRDGVHLFLARSPHKGTDTDQEVRSIPAQGRAFFSHLMSIPEVLTGSPGGAGDVDEPVMHVLPRKAETVWKRTLTRIVSGNKSWFHCIYRKH